MNEVNRQALFSRVGALLDEGYHCSEAIYWGCYQIYPNKIPLEGMKLATPLAGGIGGTAMGLCGALTGGILAIGALHGRLDGVTNDEHCQEIAKRYYQQFEKHFGKTICQDLKDDWRGKPGQETCQVLVSQAMQILVELLEE